MAIFGDEPDVVANRLAKMLKEQRAPGFEELKDELSLDDLKVWYERHGAAYLETLQAR